MQIVGPCYFLKFKKHTDCAFLSYILFSRSKRAVLIKLIYAAKLLNYIVVHILCNVMLTKLSSRSLPFTKFLFYTIDI